MSMIHVETSAPMSARWHRQSSHRTLRAAAKAAAGVSGTCCARIAVDARTLAALARAGEVYETAGGEWIAPAHGVAIEAL